MKKIVFIGDSITDAHHNYTEDNLGDGYVKIIAEKLGDEYEVINKGHDAFTVFSLWKFLDSDCISKKPDMVSILIGCNDVAVKMNTGRSLKEQEFQKTYEKLLRKIRAKTEAKIICMGPFIFPHPLEYANWIPDIRLAESQAREAAEKYDAIFLPLHDVLNDAAEQHGYDEITVDGTHLAMRGAEIVAERWMEVFSKI